VKVGHLSDPSAEEKKLFCPCFCTSDGVRSVPVATQFAIERKEVQYILRIGEICLEGKMKKVEIGRRRSRDP
jgi:hypothetical protein